MKKAIITLLLIVATLGCTGGGGPGGSTAGVTIELSSESVSPGSSTAMTATIYNPWENDLENGVLQILPARAEITFDNAGRTADIDVLANSDQTIYSGVQVSSDAYPGIYSIYSDFCFHYVTTGYQRVVVSPGDAQTPAINGYSNGPFSISFGGDPTINSLSQSQTMLLFTITNSYNGTVMAEIGNASKERRVKGILAAIPSDIFEITPPSGWNCGATGGIDSDAGQPSGTVCEDDGGNPNQELCDTTVPYQSMCMNDGTCTKCTSSINGQCEMTALSKTYCCCNGVWFYSECPSGMDATNAVICTINEPLLVSNNLQSNFKLVLKEPAPDYETERTIRLQTDYYYCIRSNTVSLTVS